MSDFNVQRSMALAAECLRGNAAVLAAASDADPLRIDFPPLPGFTRDATITASTVRALATLYQQANLEMAGLLAVAEVLGELRAQLRTISVDAARKLEPFVHPPAGTYPRARRLALFSRVFGLGPAPDQGMANHDFERVLASLCLVLQRCAGDFRFAATLGASREAELRYAASAVLFNLAPRQYGETLLAVPAIHRQLRHAITALTDPSLLAEFRARTMWDLIANAAGDGARDLGRFITRAEAGLRILHWLSTKLDAINRSERLVVREDPLFVPAAQWLQATGIEIPEVRSAA